MNLHAIVRYLRKNPSGGFRLSNGFIVAADFIDYIDEIEMSHMCLHGAASIWLMECIRLGRPVGTVRCGGESTGIEHRPSFAHQRVKRPIRQRSATSAGPRM